jgi:hypothetical protein
LACLRGGRCPAPSLISCGVGRAGPPAPAAPRARLSLKCKVKSIPNYCPRMELGKPSPFSPGGAPPWSPAYGLPWSHESPRLPERWPNRPIDPRHRSFTVPHWSGAALGLIRCCQGAQAVIVRGAGQGVRRPWVTRRRQVNAEGRPCPRQPAPPHSKAKWIHCNRGGRGRRPGSVGGAGQGGRAPQKGLLRPAGSDEVAPCSAAIAEPDYPYPCKSHV